MKRNRKLWLGAGCVAAALLLALVIWIMIAPEEQTPAPQPAVNTTAQAQITGTEDTLRPGQTTAGTEGTQSFGVNFPRPVSGCQLELRSMTNYTGAYVEDGTNQQVTDVAMAHIVNVGTEPVEFAQVEVTWGEETLQFQVSLLLPGESVLVQEAQRKAMPEGSVTQCSAEVAFLAETDWEQQLSVTDNGDGSLTVANLTDRDIALVRLFYKYHSQEQQLYVGGIAFSAKINGLKAGQSVTIRPSHYITGDSRVVTAVIYDVAQ